MAVYSPHEHQSKKSHIYVIGELWLCVCVYRLGRRVCLIGIELPRRRIDLDTAALYLSNTKKKKTHTQTASHGKCNRIVGASANFNIYDALKAFGAALLRAAKDYILNVSVEPPELESNVDLVRRDCLFDVRREGDGLG